MSLIKRLLNIKTVDLDNDGKIETLREEVQGLFAQFRNIVDKLKETNDTLKSVIYEEKLAQEVELDRLERIKAEVEARIEKSNKIISKAEVEIEANNKMQEKVSEFLPKQ